MKRDLQQDTVVTRRVQQNKGSPRIWLEGKLLDEYGFAARTPYRVEIGRYAVTLTADPDGTRQVSGKDRPTDADPHYRHPVIDLHQKALLDFVRGAGLVTVTFTTGVIFIQRQED